MLAVSAAMPRKYTIDSCDEENSYRYRLDVKTCADGANVAVVVQLNPSTANCFKSDPTIGKVSCWAAQNDFGRVIFLNLFAIRETDSNSLIGKPYEVLVGPRNDAVCKTAFRQRGTIIFAWGGIHKKLLQDYYWRRLTKLHTMIGGCKIHGVGEPTAAGFPRHGRMWNSGNRTLRTLSWNELERPSD